MTIMTRRAILARSGAAALALLATSAAQAAEGTDDKPPQVPAPPGAQQVTVVLRLTAKDPAAFKDYLLKIVPVTRLASGCRYSHSYQDPQRPAEFILIQGWDSSAQQQAYVAWRDRTGALKELVEYLAKPPVVESFALFDA